MTRAAINLPRRRPPWRLPWPGVPVAIRAAMAPGPTMPWPPRERQPRNILRRLRGAALAAIAALVAASSLASFGESYHALYLWAGHHAFTGFWAAIWPLLIDTFIAIGELAVFVAMVDNWPLRHRLSAWLVTALGLAGSVAANIGHVATPDLATRATAAVPPLAAATSLWVGMGVLKRVVSNPAAVTVQFGAALPTEPPMCEQNSASSSMRTKVPKATGGGSNTVLDGQGACVHGYTRSRSSNGRDGVNNGQGDSHKQSQSSATTNAKARERVKQALTEKPGMTTAELAKRTGASERTITRARQDLAKSGDTQYVTHVKPSG